MPKAGDRLKWFKVGNDYYDDPSASYVIVDHDGDQSVVFGGMAIKLSMLSAYELKT